MEKEKILIAIKKARETSKKRSFRQSVDFVINLVHVDTKKVKISDSVVLPAGRGKPLKVVVVADGEVALEAKNAGADLVITHDDFPRYDKKAVKRLAKEYDWFAVQSPLMQGFARTFGAVLGSRGKMPLPKDVLPPTGNPAAAISRLRQSVRVRIKDRPIIHTAVGMEDMPDEQLLENILTVYNAVVHKLERGDQSIGGMYLKTTMGGTVRV